MIYRLEQSSGIIYTEEEYWENYKYAMPDRGVTSTCWDMLPIVNIPEGKEKEIRIKMLHIYAPRSIPEVGTIIADDIDSADKWFVFDIHPIMGALVENCNNPSSRKNWTGPFLTIVGAGESIVDKMRPFQMAYNQAMCNGEKI